MIHTSLLSLSLVCGLASIAAAQTNPTEGPAAGNVYIEVESGQVVAFQDGNGPWKVITSSQELPVSDAQGRYSIFEGPVGEEKASTLFHGTLAELNTEKAIKESKLEGSVTNAPSTGILSAFTCGQFVKVESGKFSLDVPADKAVDLCVAHYLGTQESETHKAEKLILRRGVKAGDNLSLPWSSAVSLGSAKANVSGMPSGYSLISTSAEFHTTQGGHFVTWMGESTGSAFSYPTVPANLFQTGDTYLLHATAADETHKIEATLTTTSNTNTLALPAPINPPTPTLVGKSPARFSYKSIQGGDFESIISTDVETDPIFTVNITKGYLNGSTTYTMPDLSKIQGWKNTFMPSGTLSVIYSITTENEKGEQETAKLFSIKS